MPKKSQEQMILEHLKAGKSITPIEALNLFNCFRLGARIWALKQKGYRIEEVDERQNNKTFARYYLSPISRIKQTMEGLT